MKIETNPKTTNPLNKVEEASTYKESDLAIRRKKELIKLGFSFDEGEKLIDFDDVKDQRGSAYNIGQIAGGQPILSEEPGIQKESLIFITNGEKRKVEDKAADGVTRGPDALLRGSLIRHNLRVNFYDGNGVLIKQIDTILSFRDIIFSKIKDVRIKEIPKVMLGLKIKGIVTTLYEESGKIKSVIPELARL